MAANPLHLLLELLGFSESEPVPEGTVRVLYDPGGKRRLAVYRCSDRSFRSREEIFDDKLLEMKWRPGVLSEGFSSPEEAVERAREALPWLWAVRD